MSGETQAVNSAGDDRTVNNTLRHAYRILSDGERAWMLAIKDKGQEFLDLLHKAGGTSPMSGRHASRELSLAQTKIEEAVMWAVKHVTS